MTRRLFYLLVLAPFATAQKRHALIDWVRAIIQFSRDLKDPSDEDLLVKAILLTVQGAAVKTDRLESLAAHVAEWTQKELGLIRGDSKL
jgi:hypothetical protein